MVTATQRTNERMTGHLVAALTDGMSAAVRESVYRELAAITGRFDLPAGQPISDANDMPCVDAEVLAHTNL